MQIGIPFRFWHSRRRTTTASLNVNEILRYRGTLRHTPVGHRLLEIIYNATSGSSRKRRRKVRKW